MKKIIASLSLLWVINLSAQQLPTFSQYMLNPYLINPAAAGFRGETSVFLHYRNQWMGFTNSPRSFAVTLDAPIYNDKMGLGVQFHNDQTHFLSNLAGRLSYRYSFNVAEGHRIGLGLYGGFVQRNVYFSRVDDADMQDPVLFQNDVSGSIFDAGFGAWYDWGALEAGFAIEQMLNSTFSFTDDISGNSASVQSRMHLILNAAYEYKFKNEDWSVKPCVVLRGFQGSNITTEFTAIGKWRDMIWVGAGYRQNFGVIFLAGVKVFDQITFGYSYDYSTGDIKNYTTGSHEVLLSYQFGSANNSGSNAETQRRLRQQAYEIRELKQQTEQLSEELEAQKQEIERLKGVEQRDSSEMAEVIRQNKVDEIPEDAGTARVGSQASDASNAALAARIEQLEKQLDDMDASKGSSSDEMQEKVQKLETEIALLKQSQKDGSITDPTPGKYYVVTGAYFSISDAKTLQNILKREMDMETSVVSRQDRKYFFVVTKEVSDNDEAQGEMKRLKELGIKKYINGNLWIYKQ